jgi:molybdate transport system ATP-binding protein
VLEVKLRKTLPGFNLAVDLSIEKEILTILGPSGSGKTMTLKCIAGLVRPDSGYIRLNGRVLFDSEKNINLPARLRKVGFVFQNYALFPHLTVNDNIAYGQHGRSRLELKNAVSKLLETMHIEGLGQRYPNQLSSGQQQRVALARALFQQPDILLLDEPFSALDTQRKERLEYELMNLQQSYHGDMLFVTHDIAQGYKLGSRMAVFDSGHIAQCDSKEKVINSPVNRTVALLTGVKNLIKAEISGIEKECIWVTVPDLGKIKILNKALTQFMVNQVVLIGIRPEYLRLTDHAGENTLSVVVKRVVEGVSNASCYLSTNNKNSDGYDVEMTISKSKAKQLINGQSYYLLLPPEYLVMIPDLPESL